MAGSGRGPRAAHTPAWGLIRSWRRPAATRYLDVFLQLSEGCGSVAPARPWSVPLPVAAGAAGHQFLDGWLWPVGIALALVVFYLIECWWFPFARCWCCSGTGRHAREDRKVWRDCWVCRGSGKRLRIGRRVWNAVQRRRAGAR